MTQVIKDVVEWLQQWFYTEDEIDAMLSDLPSGGGISSITLVPYSENANGVICYDGGVSPTPTPVVVVDSVSLSSDVSILSAYDSDTATLTATVLDEDNQAIPNVSVEFFKGSTSLGSANTNNNGIATKTYSANGDGELTFKAVVDNVEDELTIIDAKFYASNSAIDSQATTFDSHNVSFLNYAIQYDEAVYFKFNTKPTHCLIGIGSSTQSGLVLEFNTNLSKYHRNYSTGGSYSNNWLDTHSEIGINPVFNGSRARGNVYLDKVYYDYWQFNLTSTVQKLRIDKFPNDDYNIEVYVL